jgi:hypothetical protein
MRLVILWAGIAAFVLIGVFPPMAGLWPGYHGGPIRGNITVYSLDIPTEYHVDTGCLLGHLATVVALTGGLLWTEAQVRPRLYPWLRAKRQTLLRTALAIVLSVVVAILAIWLNPLGGLFR